MLQMQVCKYIPDKLYGFLIFPETERQVFFHLGSFDPGMLQVSPDACKACPKNGLGCSWPNVPLPPILGETVDVDIDLDGNTREEKPPKANKVLRVNSPTVLSGKVTTFDGQLGYGFLVDETGKSHYLHRSEVLEGRMPLPGQSVMFCAGLRQGRSRACHVKLCT
jgi:cold shock CspA family protein